MTFQATLLNFLGSSEPFLPDLVTCTQEEISPATYLLTLTSKKATEQTFSGSYDKPKIYTSFTPSTSPISDQLSFLGFQCTEFALPIHADASLNFNFFSRPGFTRPHTVFPLLAFSPTGCLLIAPIDFFHEQIIAICGNEIRWGWSGDLEQVEAGFETKLAVIRRDSPREALDDWGVMIRTVAREQGIINSRGRYADVSVAKLSYWTDNGAAYWYRTEPGMDLPTTLERTICALDYAKVPVTAVELDSWFYPHWITRKVTHVGYLDVVPPTGMLCWEPRADVLPDGVVGMRKRLGNRPLILHSRHISVENQYMKADSKHPERKWWIDNDRSHPVDDHWFRTWMQQASDWGAVTYEQDWLVEVWLGVRGLRARPGRISRWQRQLNDSAAERSISLIWCMATPADMATAVSLEQIIAVRSCDDYRYADDPSTLWRWHLTTSALIRSLGLWPYKDVFMSHGNQSGIVDIDGDPNALLEACLAALSAGPFGIGDRLERTDREVVMKACRSDGMIIKPDYPMAALDRSLVDPRSLLWAETNCGAWRYILVIRTGIKASSDPSSNEPLQESLSLGKEEDYLVYDWKTGETYLASKRDYKVTASLRIHEWTLWVVCPILIHVRSSRTARDSFTVVGDKNTFATIGDRRFRFHSGFTATTATTVKVTPRTSEAQIDRHESVEGSPSAQILKHQTVASFEFDVLGVHGESVDVLYWSQTGGLATETVSVPAKGWRHAVVRFDADLDKVILEQE